VRWGGTRTASCCCCLTVVVALGLHVHQITRAVKWSCPLSAEACAWDLDRLGPLLPNLQWGQGHSCSSSILLMRLGLGLGWGLGLEGEGEG
jgi:hypothetical protein